MKTFLLSITLTATAVCSSLAEHGRDTRVVFDNRSVTHVTVYLRTAFDRFQPMKALGPGEAFASPASVGQEWIVATPVYYRPIEYLKVGGWARRVVITDANVRSVGGRQVPMRFESHARGSIDLFKVIDGDEVHWSKLEPGASKNLASFEGREWVARSAINGQELRRVTTGRAAATVVVEPAHPRGHIRGGHGHGHDDLGLPIELVIANRGPNTVVVSKKTRFGTRRIGTLDAGRSGSVETEAGDVWQVEDVLSQRLLQTIVIPNTGRRHVVTVSGHGRGHGHGSHHPPAPPAPPAPRKVNVKIYNDTPEIIYIYKEKDDGWKYTKRIYPDRYYKLEFYVGQRVSVRDPDSGREIHKFDAPRENALVRIDPPRAPGHDGHRHSGDDHRHAEEEEGGGPPRPGTILRRLLGRD